MAKIYASGNYVIVEDGANTFEYAKGHSLYTYSGGVYTIKEITQGEFKVSDRQIDDGLITNNLSVAYTKATFITFLRENTGFKTASGGSGATWGDITGTLSAQTDLQTAIDEKLNEDFSSLTSAEPLDGTEVVPIVQDGATVKVTTQDIADLGGGGGGGGLQGIHAIRTLSSGQIASSITTGGSISNTSIFTSRLYFIPFIPNQSFTASALAINVTTGGVGALAKVLVYSDLNGVPNTKLYESAELDCSTTGTKTATTTFNFVQGTFYWLSITCNISFAMPFIGTAALIPINITNTFTVQYHYTYSVTYPTTPTTIPSVTGQTSAVPFIGVIKS
jgi:hypothetical protein